jgi:hypothetical protein
MVRHRPQSEAHSAAMRAALTASSSCSSTGWPYSSRTVSRMSFSLTSMICSLVSSSSASGTVWRSTSKRSVSGIAWHIRKLSTKTSTCRPWSSSKNSARSRACIALNDTCGT